MAGIPFIGQNLPFAVGAYFSLATWAAWAYYVVVQRGKRRKDNERGPTNGQKPKPNQLKGHEMANQKKQQSLTVVTTWTIIETIIDMASDDTIDKALTDAGIDYANADDVRAKVQKMHRAVEKTANAAKSRAKVETPSARENRQYAADILARMEKDPDTSITTHDVVNALPYVTSTQRAVAVLNVLLKSGKIEHDPDAKGRVAYRLVRQ